MQARLPLVAICALLGVAEGISKDTLQDVLARMDQAAASFQSMTARATIVQHTDVIDENDTESAGVIMKKLGQNQVEGLLDFTEPANSKRTVSFSSRQAQIYSPKIKQVQIYDLGTFGEQIDQFIMMGFGTSGTELAKSYTMRVLGTESLNGQSTVKLELIPKSDDVRNKYVTKIEMSVPDQGGPYPLQEKIYQPSGDYRFITYSDLKINPKLKSDAVKLKVPAGVQTVYPQK